MSLNSPSVDGLNLEGSTLALWHEFLEGFFDGATHTVGLIPGVKFPQAILRFQESSLPQTMDGTIGLSVVWVAPSKVDKYRDKLTPADIPTGLTPSQDQWRAEAHCAFLFLIRAVSAGSNDNSQLQVQSASSKLFGLLQNSLSTKPLAEKGIVRIRPAPPRMAFPGDGAPAADLGFRLRTLTCAVTLRYPILSQT